MSTRYRYGYEVKANLLTIILFAITAGQGDAEDQRVEVAKKEFDLNKIPAELTTAGGEVKSVFAYGAQKLLQDRTASMNSGTETDALAKLEAIEKVFHSLSEGKWSEGRESTAGSKPARSSAIQDTLLAKAIAELSGKPELAVMAMIAKKTKDEKKALAAAEAVAAVIARLEKEMSEIDLSDMGI